MKIYNSHYEFKTHPDVIHILTPEKPSIKISRFMYGVSPPSWLSTYVFPSLQGYSPISTMPRKEIHIVDINNLNTWSGQEKFIQKTTTDGYSIETQSYLLDESGFNKLSSGSRSHSTYIIYDFSLCLHDLKNCFGQKSVYKFDASNIEYYSEVTYYSSLINKDKILIGFPRFTYNRT